MKKILITIIVGLTAMFRLSASEIDSTKHWGYSLSLNPTRLLIMDEYQRKWQKKTNNFSIDLSAIRQWLPNDSSQTAVDYNYPALSISLKYSLNHGVIMHRPPSSAWQFRDEVNYDSQMGNSLSLYGSFIRPIIRTRKWVFDYSLGFGAAYSHRIYNPYNNADNELVGSHLSIYFGAGTHLTYMVTNDFGVRLGLDYWHISNGAIDRPNKGANSIGPSIGVVYAPYHEELNNYRRNKIKDKTINEASSPVENIRSWHPYLFTNVAFAIGAKTLHEDWNHCYFGSKPDDKEYYRTDYTIHATYSAQLDLMYRYARRWASGIGFDVFYGHYAKTIARVYDTDTDYRHSPWSTGMALKHEIYFDRLLCQIGIGYYLHREMGYFASLVDKPYYERVGISYDFPRLGGFRIGFNIKAHFTKADYTELIITMPIKIKTLSNRK